MSQENYLNYGVLLSQLGGGMFVMMTGCKEFKKGCNYLSMTIPDCDKADQLKVIYDVGSDLYIMEFSLDGIIVERLKDIYFDELQSTFTKITGLYTSL